MLCLELVYGRSVKLLLERRVSKMAPAWGSADPGRNVRHGNLRVTTIWDISRSRESRENGVTGCSTSLARKYFVRGRGPYFAQEIARESYASQKDTRK